jgi:8-amino-3,8-dideoxy-alpha-D-manno-octulosonate transaminase
VLIEDACQAMGATFNGKALGTFGQMGCFSFDAVKTVTCGEGGAVITDEKQRYQIADAFADHGHDHIGADRGLEGHPILGANYRISELNAAVGLAQLRKLDRMLAVQRKSKNAVKSAIKKIPGVTLRELPDQDGDSATFLSFFLPDEDRARKAIGLLNKAGVDGCFYWYDNNWHYHRKWDHLKNFQTAATLPIALAENPPDYQSLCLKQSDHLISRLISMQVKLSWSEDDLSRRIEKVESVLKQL